MVLLRLVLIGLLASAIGCQSGSGRGSTANQGTPQMRGMVIRPQGRMLCAMSFNLQGLTEKAPKERLARLKAIVEKTRANVIGFQEVESKKALVRWLGDDWTVVMSDSGRERKELALAVRRPFRVLAWEMAFPRGRDDKMFPGERDVIRCSIVTPEQIRFNVYVAQLTGRERAKAATMLANDIRNSRSERTVVLGDFGVNPGDPSLEPLKEAPIVNLAEELSRKGMATAGPAIRSKSANKDPGAKPAMYDHIWVSHVMQSRFADQLHIVDPKEVLSGTPPVLRNGEVAKEGTRASGRLPVWALVKLPTPRTGSFSQPQPDQ